MQQLDGFLPAPLPLKKLVWEAPEYLLRVVILFMTRPPPLFWLLELWSGIQAWTNRLTH